MSAIGLPNDFESHIVPLLRHLISKQELLPLSIKLESPGSLSVEDSVDKLPILSISRTQIPNMSRCLYICEQSCWMKVQPLIQVISNCFDNSGSACICLYVKNYTTSLVWHCGMSYTDSVHGNKEHTGKIWFHIPAKWHRQFEWIVSKKLSLHVAGTPVLEILDEASNNTVEVNCVNHQRIRVLHMVHHNKSDLAFLSCLRSDRKWSKPEIAKYISHVVLDGHAVMNTFWLFTNTDSEGQEGTGRSVQHESSYSKEGGSQSPLDGSLQHEMDIEEMDLSHIKTEEDENIRDMDGSPKSEEAGAIENQPSKSKCGSIEMFRSFLVKYSIAAKKEGVYFCGAEPFLLVECPRCSMAYKGTTNRLLRLVNHIEKQHDRDSSYLLQILKHKYHRLIQCMTKKLEQGKLWPLHKK